MVQTMVRLQVFEYGANYGVPAGIHSSFIHHLGLDVCFQYKYHDSLGIGL